MGWKEIMKKKVGEIEKERGSERKIERWGERGGRGG